MNMTVIGANATFVDGKLALQYFNVNFDAGEFPDRINGSLQVTPDDGVAITSTVEEVKAAAITKIKQLIELEPAATDAVTSTAATPAS